MAALFARPTRESPERQTRPCRLKDAPLGAVTPEGKQSAKRPAGGAASTSRESPRMGYARLPSAVRLAIDKSARQPAVRPPFVPARFPAGTPDPRSGRAAPGLRHSKRGRTAARRPGPAPARGQETSRRRARYHGGAPPHTRVPQEPAAPPSMPPSAWLHRAEACRRERGASQSW